MKLTVLGCNGPYPQANGACSGYLLESGDTHVLLDCGAGVLARLTALMPPESLDAVILSHLHYDHMSDMLPLIYRLQGSARRLPVYLPSEPAAVYSLLAGAFETHGLADGGQIGALTLAALPVRHPAPCYAVRLDDGEKRFCYTGDTNTCDGLTEFVQGSDLLLADACFTDALWAESKPHLSARLAAQTAARAGAKGLILTHFTPGIPQDTLLREGREAYPTAQLAAPGLTVRF